MSKYLIALLLIFVTTPVHSKEKSNQKNVKVVYEDNTKIDFEAKSVDGEFLNPDGSAVRGDQNLDFDSMLAPKKNFNKESRRGARAVR